LATSDLTIVSAAGVNTLRRAVTHPPELPADELKLGLMKSFQHQRNQTSDTRDADVQAAKKKGAKDDRVMLTTECVCEVSANCSAVRHRRQPKQIARHPARIDGPIADIRV